MKLHRPVKTQSNGMAENIKSGFRSASRSDAEVSEDDPINLGQDRFEHSEYRWSLVPSKAPGQVDAGDLL